MCAVLTRTNTGYYQTITLLNTTVPYNYTIQGQASDPMIRYAMLMMTHCAIRCT